MCCMGTIDLIGRNIVKASELGENKYDESEFDENKLLLLLGQKTETEYFKHART